jgi:hypothetical protein
MDNRRVVMLYVIMMVIFGAIFFLAYVSLNRNVNLFGIRGIPAEFEDWLIMILCIGSIIKIIYELSVIDKK